MSFYSNNIGKHTAGAFSGSNFHKINKENLSPELGND